MNPVPQPGPPISSLFPAHSLCLFPTLGLRCHLHDHPDAQLRHPSSAIVSEMN